MNQKRLWGGDAAWLSLLMLYVVLGTSAAPFHGDEATLIAMSADFHHRFVDGDVNHLRYAKTPRDPMEQGLRLVNGTLPPNLIGLAWTLGDFDVDDINQRWHWGRGWDWNTSQGHAPSQALLRTARWPSALLTALSVAAIFALGLLWNGRAAAYTASFVLATHPVVLLQGRRAIMEASLLFFGLLSLVLALTWVVGSASVRSTDRDARGLAVRRGRLMACLLGVSAGLAVASKHSGLVPVAAAYGVAAYVLFRRREDERWEPAVLLLASAALALATFLFLNPAWWDAPFTRAFEVLELRRSMVANQAALFTGSSYPGFGAKLRGLVAEVSVAPLVYYELQSWASPLADAIHRYEASSLSGLRFGGSAGARTLGIGMLSLSFIGLWRLAFGIRSGRPVALLIGLWLALTLWLILGAVPLAWQRYYMPLYPIQALLVGGACAWLTRQVRGMPE